MLAMSANAQIIYTDVDPDTTIICPAQVPCTGCDSSQIFYLGLNHDNILDFRLVAQIYQFEEGNWYDAYDLRIEIMAPLSPNRTGWSKMNYGDEIGPDYFWQTGSTFNSWINNDEYYMGLRLFKDNQYYYGWVLVKLVVTYNRGLTIKEYAYNTIPQLPIKAGEGTVGIDNIEITDNNIYITNKTLNIVNLSPDCIIDLYNMSGQKMNTYNITGNHNSFDLSAYSEGVYVLKVQCNKSVYSKTIIVN
ncbi:MAG: hypothetical protein A2W98_06500 [Bacteroidetes bacterium GWF2_33_38]|nr:MAG: hypothetical protein A2W98_06500 [Bacteroidetes bacterium GWF2_33_38]OFY72952.1 MAG: hypothetical protein A2265_10595 [Bacteroidetes bacterium RIFOXYA12_FULL_33_9]OFY92313.1 MAG: hypothetical protein A2236_01740 [Bacteroidetes bacterium RIFOXYA2_FULL_33_7]